MIMHVIYIYIYILLLFMGYHVKALHKKTDKRLGLNRQEVPDSTPWEVPEIEPMEPVRSTDLADLWSPLGVTWVEHNRCVVPGNFPQDQLAGDTLEAYAHTRSSASLFDVSFKDLSKTALGCFGLGCLGARLPAGGAEADRHGSGVRGRPVPHLQPAVHADR